MEHLGKAWAKTTCSPQWKFHRRAFGDGSCESCFAFKAWSTSCNKSSTALCHSRCLRLSVPPPNADGYHGSSGPKIKGYRVDHFAFFPNDVWSVDQKHISTNPIEIFLWAWNGTAMEVRSPGDKICTYVIAQYCTYQLTSGANNDQYIMGGSINGDTPQIDGLWWKNALTWHYLLDIFGVPSFLETISFGWTRWAAAGSNVPKSAGKRFAASERRSALTTFRAVQPWRRFGCFDQCVGKATKKPNKAI